MDQRHSIELSTVLFSIAFLLESPQSNVPPFSLALQNTRMCPLRYPLLLVEERGGHSYLVHNLEKEEKEEEEEEEEEEKEEEEEINEGNKTNEKIWQAVEHEFNIHVIIITYIAYEHNTHMYMYTIHVHCI